MSSAAREALAWTFVRHGLTRDNTLGLLNGWYDANLLPEGILQNRLLGAALAERKYERILCSDLRRARSSAVTIAEQAGWPPPEQSPGTWDFSPALRERAMGEWQGRPLEELRRTGEVQRLLSWNGAPPRGESLCDLARRILRYLASQPAVPTLVVAHAGPLRVILGLLDGLAPDEIGKLKIRPSFPYHRQLEPGCWEALLQELP